MLAGGRYDTIDRTLGDGDVGALAVDAAGQLKIVHAALTELAAAINSSRLDVNIAATGVTQAVSGTVTANAGTGSFNSDAVAAEGGAVANGVLIQGDDGTDRKNINVDATTGDVQVDITHTVTVDGSGVTQPISAASLPLPSGAATSANQSTGNTSLSTIAGAVSGAEMQVDVVAALPAGANAIGKLAANSGVDIGDVDVTSVVPGTAATSLGKAEDAAHADGDVGVMALAVRNDDLAALAGSDGDYAPLQVTQNGALLMCPAANDDYKYAVIDEATSGNNTLVAAVASRKVRVLSAFMVAAGDVVVRFEDGASGTALTGQMDLTANSGFTLPFNPAGWFETSVNTLLNLELDGAVSVDGCLTYIEIP